MFGNGIVGNVLDNSHGDLGRNALPAGMNRSNRSDDFFPQHAFQEIACGPRPLSPQRLNIALVCRQEPQRIWQSGIRVGIARMASIPFITGICRSIKITSGRWIRKLSMASRPLLASPTRRMSSARCSTAGKRAFGRKNVGQISPLLPTTRPEIHRAPTTSVLSPESEGNSLKSSSLAQNKTERTHPLPPNYTNQCTCHPRHNPNEPTTNPPTRKTPSAYATMKRHAPNLLPGRFFGN